MELLVESDSYGNLGDTSMAEGVVLQLRDLLPRARIHSVVPRGVRTAIWDVTGITRQAPYKVSPFAVGALSHLPFFRHNSDFRQSTASIFTMSGLGRFLRAGSLSLYFEDPAQTTIRKLAQFCQQFDGLHIAGGGNLTDTFPRELFRKCCVIHAFAEQRKPIVLTGQQLGPFKSPLLRKALGRALRKANFVGVRDPGESLTFCSKAHLDQESFAFMGDDSLGLSPASDSSVRELLEQHGLRANRFLALNLRFTSYALRDPSCFQTFGSLVDSLATLFGMPVLVVPIQLLGADSDVASGQKIVDAASSAPVSLLRQHDLTAPLVKGVLGKAFGAIGVSHHFCTYALSQGVPAVCIYEGDYYKQKALALAASWGDNRLAIPLRRLGLATAARDIAYVLEDETLRAKLYSLSKIATQRWRELFHQKVSAVYRAPPSFDRQ
jgi:polysaccharide pyruvyl transferase WcaK-like protein